METRTEQVNVFVDAREHEQFVDILEQCKQAGLDVEAELEDIGVLRGSIDSGKLKRLNAVSGVVAVERERSYQLPPPESEIQSVDPDLPDPLRER